jgi:hypothetical protein
MPLTLNVIDAQNWALAKTLKLLKTNCQNLTAGDSFWLILQEESQVWYDLLMQEEMLFQTFMSLGEGVKVHVSLP